MAKRRKRTTKSTAMQMSSSNACYICCPNHKRWGLIALLIGLIYLIQDYTGGPAFWRLSWYTVVFLLIGFCWFSKK